jgi:hypothetical protein
MWCANCRAEVAAEVASNHRDLRCATCGEVFPPATAADKTREARQLLERWSYDELLPPAPLAEESNTSAPAAHSETPRPPARAVEPVKPVFRFDAGHAPSEQARPAPPEPATERQREFPAWGETLHSPHVPSVPAPHVEVGEFIQDEEGPKSSNWVAASGQFLAYGGVAVLTIGATLVVWGFFGGPAHYAPTGWLTVTIGQMLLFLGIVTLISGGMEQTTNEVSRKIQLLGDQIVRIEQAAQGHPVPPPHAPLERFTAAENSPHSGREGSDGTAVGAR